MPRPAPLAASLPAAEVGDEALVAGARAGRADCFEALMRRHNRRAFRFVRSLVRDDDEAEDVVQDAWVRAFEHLDQFAGRARFSTWLLRIAHHEVLARRRRGARFVPLPEELPMIDPGGGVPSAVPDPERAATGRQIRGALGAAVDALPASHRAVFVLRDVEGASTAEVAELLGLSEGNVKVRLHRARAALRGDLERRFGAELQRLWGFDGVRCDRLVASVLARIRSG